METTAPNLDRNGSASPVGGEAAAPATGWFLPPPYRETTLQHFSRGKGFLCGRPRPAGRPVTDPQIQGDPDYCCRECVALLLSSDHTRLAPLPKITDSTWQLCLSNRKQFGIAVGLAESCGVPCHPGLAAEDEDWRLEFWAGSLWASMTKEPAMRQVTTSEFKAMCDAHAARPA